MAQVNDCPFCNQTEWYRWLYKRKLVYAMYPKSPVIPYHVLLIPKRHVQCIDELTSPEIIGLHDLLQRFVAQSKLQLTDFAGYNLLSNNGNETVNQRVKHCHLHLFLRRQSDIAPFIPTNWRDAMPFTKEELVNLESLKRWMDIRQSTKNARSQSGE